MVRMSRIAAGAGCLLVTAMLTACSGVAGTPTAGELDVRKLEVGPYPVDRHKYDQNSSGKGALLEGMRMSDAVPPAVKVDSSLIHGRGNTVFADTEKAIDFLANVSQPILEKRKMVAGYAASGADQPDPEGSTRPAAGTTAITTVVLRFPDESAAKNAAKELEDADIGVSPDNRKLLSTKYPDAFLHWRPGIANAGAFYAHKSFVISLFVARPRADSSDLISWVDKTLAVQIPVLDSFQATPADKLDSLKVDPDGMLARVAVQDRKEHTPDPQKFAIFGPNHFVHDSDDEGRAAKLLAETGVDKTAHVSAGSVFRARDDAAAQQLLPGLITEAGDKFDSISAPEDVPGAKCLKLNSKGDTERDYKYRCYVQYKRYVALVTSDKEPDVRQKVAAQYALLANSL
ncbi:hypothetical protein [Nocardia sp. XZ_19_385]|uniref:DUF7373 family lipoprotein n=1 Tax=Nocardia sp. XZ_19_385 TaxID=2769488 RepID=UPI00188FBD0D|nr:hypothetical protein [Nocardia sp. XZ_19_385]